LCAVGPCMQWLRVMQWLSVLINAKSHMCKQLFLQVGNKYKIWLQNHALDEIIRCFFASTFQQQPITLQMLQLLIPMVFIGRQSHSWALLQASMAHLYCWPFKHPEAYRVWVWVRVKVWVKDKLESTVTHFLFSIPCPLPVVLWFVQAPFVSCYGHQCSCGRPPEHVHLCGLITGSQRKHLFHDLSLCDGR